MEIFELNGLYQDEVAYRTLIDREVTNIARSY